MIWACSECGKQTCIVGVSLEFPEDITEIRDPDKCPWEGCETAFKPLWPGDKSNIELPAGLGDARKEHLGGRA